MCKQVVVTVVAACVMAGASVPVLGEPPSAAVASVEVAQRPLVDGKLQDACWQEGAWQDQMHLLGQDGPPTQGTRFCVLCDEDNLYLGVESMEPAMDKLKEVRGGGIFRGESIELFFDLNRDRETYYHLTTNTLGVCEGSGYGREFVWRASATKGEDRWTSEMVIPFSSFAITPEVGATWNFNLCRQRYAGKRELSTWAPLGPQGGFHQPELFGELRGLDVDLSRFCFEVGDPEQHTEIRGQALDVEFELPVSNATGEAADLRLEGCLIPAEGRPQTQEAELSLGDGERGAVRLSGYRVEQSGDYTLLVALTDPTAGRVYCRTKFGVRLEYTPLGIRVVQPSYRATIFATQEIDEVQLLVEVGLEQAALKTSALEVKLAAAGGEQALQARRVAPLPAAQVPVSFDARGLEVGDYLITASLLDAAGQVLGTTEQELHKLPPAPGSEVTLDENSNTLINGVPTFIYGYFSVVGTYRGTEWKGMKQTHADGCTALLHYGAGYWSQESGTRFLDEAHANGLGVVIYPYYRTFFRDGGLAKIGDPDTALTQEMNQGITEAVNMWKEHPALLAWFLSDEPDCNNWSPEALEQVYQLVKGLDPYHPCIVLCRYAGTHHLVRRCADIFMPDPYIHPRLDGQFDVPLTSFPDYFGAIEETGKAPWVTPQAFGSGFRNESTLCEPSFEHLRAMAYMSIVHGCKGVLYYAWNYLTAFPASYRGARFLSKEVAALAPALLSPTSEAEVRIEPQDSEIDVLSKEHEGHLYLIAVNTQFREMDATFEVPGLGGRPVSVISEDRKVEVEGNGFADHFGRYQVHLYTTAPEPPDCGMSLEEIRAEVAAIQATRFKEGNLCLRMTRDGELTGVNIEGPQGVHSIDGITDLFTSWKWSAHPKPPVDLTASFPREETISRVVVYTPTISHYQVQVPEAEGWRTVATVAGNTEQVVTSRFDPVKTEKLRLHITGVNTPEWEMEQYGFAGRGVVVDEVEAYAD